ncbi:hypothetical protein BDF14DRAFT_507060 [Spinellus fusiger]|nr:hypothetical protein BDF14DRAFT_507060 [Spinellus fusiger]
MKTPTPSTSAAAAAAAKTTTAAAAQKTPSALSSVVSDLIRAAAGSDAQTVADEDLDHYVANLILKEAEAKRKQYNRVGVRAYQPDTGQ